MKAAICRAWGPPSVLVVEEISPPALPSGCVRIRVRAAGVGFQDILMVAGRYETKPEFPFAPGNEVAGEVMSAVPGSLLSLQVIVSWRYWNTEDMRSRLWLPKLL